MIDLILLGLSIVLYLAYASSKGHRQKADESLLLVAKDIAFYMEKGESQESAITKATEQSSIGSDMYKKVLAKMKEGKPLPESLEAVAEKESSPMFTYLAGPIAAGSGAALRELVQKTMQAREIDEALGEKTDRAIFTCRLFGVLVLPATYYAMAAITGAEISMFFQIYLGAVGFVMMLMDFTLKKDIIGSVMFLPLAATIFYVSITRIGPLLMANLSGLV